MNKEIEELLNRLKEVTNSKKLSSTYCITNKHWQLLLSYIEQLEKEKDIAEYNYNSLHGAVVEIARELKIEEPEFTNTEIIIDAINILQNNRDKAIEYIHNYFVLGASSEYVNKLENILKGDSDDK